MKIDHPSGALDLLPPFPEVWDSSMRSAFVSCARQWYYGYLLGLRKSAVSIHLHAGGAIAHGLEAARKAFYVQHRSAAQAVAVGLNALILFWGDFALSDEMLKSRAGVKDLPGCIDALYSYFEEFPLGQDQIEPLFVGGEALIEKSFALPVPGTAHPITGQPIVYAGRFDMVGEHGGAIYIVDEKTTLSLGSSWQSNWPLRGQLTGYVWGARSFGIDPIGVVIRGIGFLKQSIQFQQVILTRPEWLIDRWLAQLARDINRAAAMWAGGILTPDPEAAFDQAFDSACSGFGGCGYLGLCDVKDPKPWYENYMISHWDPLQRAGDIP
jgi:PD-(D/E)XK nuclease superfamily